MAHTASAKKRMRQSRKQRIRNRALVGNLKAQLKKTALALASGNVETARAEVATAVKRLDKAATKGVLHQNAASRRKSRLMTKLAALTSAASPSA